MGHSVCALAVEPNANAVVLILFANESSLPSWNYLFVKTQFLFGRSWWLEARVRWQWRRRATVNCNAPADDVEMPVNESGDGRSPNDRRQNVYIL